MISYKERLPKITTFIFDVDGVLTNNQVFLMNGEVVRSLHSKDGFILQLAAKKGYKIFIITGGNSEEVKDRLLHAGVTEVHLKSSDKMSVYDSICERHKLKHEEILYMGDDVPDIPVLKKVGISCCPQDAVSDIKAIVHYQSPIAGGHGCVREIMEQVLRVQGKWKIEEDYHW